MIPPKNINASLQRKKNTVSVLTLIAVGLLMPFIKGGEQKQPSSKDTRPKQAETAPVNVDKIQPETEAAPVKPVEKKPVTNKQVKLSDMTNDHAQQLRMDFIKFFGGIGGKSPN